MRVEIDQSGKVEDLSTSTVVAYSNGESGAIAIAAGEKRLVIRKLHQNPLTRDESAPIFFSILVFLLIKDLAVSIVEIDEEYSGKEDLITAQLSRYLSISGRRKKIFRFVRVGKHSNAHQLSWKIHRKFSKQKIKKLLAKDILVWLKK